jgi:hypothetical protein
VEKDAIATPRAIAVVVLSAVASGIGAFGGRPVGFVVGIVAALVAWVIGSGIIFFVRTKLLPEPDTKADLGELLRTLGFAASPGILHVASVIPMLGAIVRLVVMVWQIVATVIAVRCALDHRTTEKASA